MVPPPDLYTTWGGMTEEEAASFIGRYVTGPGDAARDLPVSIDYGTAELIPAPDEVADAVETTYVNGRPVFVVTADDGRRLAVTASESHNPWRLVIPVDEEFDGRGAKDGTVRFSRFGER